MKIEVQGDFARPMIPKYPILGTVDETGDIVIKFNTGCQYIHLKDGLYLHTNIPVTPLEIGYKVILTQNGTQEDAA